MWVRAVASKDGIWSDVVVFEYRLRSEMSQWWTTLPDYLRKYRWILHKEGYDTLQKVSPEVGGCLRPLHSASHGIADSMLLVGFRVLGQPWRSISCSGWTI